MLIVTTLIAIICYTAATALQWQRLKQNRSDTRNRVLVLGLAGFISHGGAVFLTLHQTEGVNLGFFSVGSLIAWLVAALVLGSSLRQRLDNLFIGVFPIAILALALAALLPDSSEYRAFESGLLVHILLSILAYSIFTLATLQAILLSRQEIALKHHNTRGLVASLPPLQLMERLLFEMLWVGFILLSLSLLSGMLFVENLFAQHLVHKTVLSIAAWVIYGILLACRHFLGWRGNRAIHWTIGGFILLMLAFFGSKLVLELLL
ncbi:cytochrome C assembly family protein [Nitrincola sp. MINF-07-Sa-05]|uniref:cytochrome C assembly family protein n=1 Tax=Nitrincola salilacus TaxID=3400273 RepID=UPI00391834EE